MESYDGRVALVTGASSGLGRHIATELARAGCDVAVTARTIERLDKLAAAIAAETGRQAVAVPGDLTVSSDRIGMLEQVERELGPPDILANVAGVVRMTQFMDEDPSRVLATNLEAPLHLTRLVVEGMVQRGFGRILNVASVAGWSGVPFIVCYSASKAGLIAFSLALREELRGSGVTATVVSPGFIADEGMYVPYQTPPPWYMGANRSKVVAHHAVRALRKNRGEVILNQLPLRPLLALGAVSDRAMRGVTRALGFTSFMQGLAQKRMPYSDAPELKRTSNAA